MNCKNCGHPPEAHNNKGKGYCMVCNNKSPDTHTCPWFEQMTKFCCRDFQTVIEDKIVIIEDNPEEQTIKYLIPIKKRERFIPYQKEPYIVESIQIYFCPYCGRPFTEP